MITVEDIRLAKPIILERITGIPAPQFFRWSMNRIPTVKSIDKIATALKTSPDTVAVAFQLRKLDYQKAQAAYQKLENLLK